MPNDSYKLISFNLCPFVQRSVITLEERNLKYEIEYIDLSDKPDWFLKISPFGKVPVLEVRDTYLFESAVINEFIDETAGGASLLPKDPLKKAYQRAWIEFATHLVMGQYLYSMAKDKASFEEHASKVQQSLARLEDQIEGPFFAGSDFSLVDAAAAPALLRLNWCESICSVDLFRDAPKAKAWQEALLSRPSVQRSTVEGIEGIFREYLKGKGSPTRNESPSYLGTLI